MAHHSAGPIMHQKIFSMNLDVETVSLYLLCCAVTDSGGPITRETLMDKWNSGSASLDKELARLEKKNILERIQEAPYEAAIYTLVDEKRWR